MRDIIHDPPRQIALQKITPPEVDDLDVCVLQKHCPRAGKGRKQQLLVLELEANTFPPLRVKGKLVQELLGLVLAKFAQARFQPSSAASRSLSVPLKASTRAGLKISI